jgi:hypothetical protein
MVSWLRTELYSMVSRNTGTTNRMKLILSPQTHGTRRRFLVALLPLLLSQQARSMWYVLLLSRSVLVLTNPRATQAILGVFWVSRAEQSLFHLIINLRMKVYESHGYIS